MLSLQHATIGYGRNIILEDASFELRPKSICGLVAPNGFGKATLLRALSGAASLMKHGSVVLDGESVYARQDVRTKLFFGPSDESLLYPQKTGTFHLKLVQELWESDAESGTAAALLGIEGFAGRPVRTYSQGMKRQLLLAMAYASQASYILLDEPLNALDPDKAERGCAALFRMAEEGASILVASHQPEELDRICGQKRGASPFLQAWGQAAHRRQAIAICKWYNARMKYKSNNNVVYSCKYHVVFCPKYRRPVLVDGVDGRFRQMAERVAGELSFDIIEMEAMPDHVHMLLEVDPQLGIHKAVKRIKGRTSHDLREEFPWLMKRLPTLWTNSYFVSTVGGAPLAIAKQYIENQKGV